MQFIIDHYVVSDYFCFCEFSEHMPHRFLRSSVCNLLKICVNALSNINVITGFIKSRLQVMASAVLHSFIAGEILR